MKRIIVFTKFTNLYGAFPIFAERADLKVLNGTQANLILWDESEKIFKPVETLFKEGLYFVYDRISNTSFNELTNGVEKSYIYVLNHQNGAAFIEQGKQVVIGVTEVKERGGKYYPDIVDILTDSKREKAKRIFEIIFTFNTTLEAKLIINKFLHIYLRKENGNAKKNKAYSFVMEKIKASGFNLDSLSEEENKSKWKEEWGKYERDNGQLELTAIDKLNQLLFAKEDE